MDGGDITLFANLKVGNVDASQIRNELANRTPQEITEGFRAVNKAVMGMYSSMSDIAKKTATSQTDAWQSSFKAQLSTVSQYADQIKYAFIEFQSKAGRGQDAQTELGRLIDELSRFPSVVQSVKTNWEALQKTMGSNKGFTTGDVSSAEATIASYNKLNGVATQVYNELNQAFLTAKRNMDTEAQDMLKVPRNAVSEYVDTLRYAFMNWHMGGDVMGGDLYNNLIGAMNAAKDVAPLMSAIGADVQVVDAQTLSLAQDMERVESATESTQRAVANGAGERSMARLADTCSETQEALSQTGRTFEVVGNQGKQSADKANNAHKNFQGTLSSVRFALSAIGINGSSMLGKLITLVGLLEDAFRGTGSAAQSIIPIFGILLSIGMSVFGTIIKYARKLITVLTQIGHKLLELSTKAVGFAKKAVTSLTDKIKGFINFFKPSLAKLKKWLMQWGLGARSPYFVIRKIRTMVIDGMKEIAQYSDSVATSMNNFKTALNQVKGSVVSAFEPIASYVIPILTRLLNILAGVLDSIARFNATLLGRSTYFKFVAADVNEYGNAVSEAGKASKKAQRDLMGFDEINRLSAPNDGGAGGAGSESKGKYVETAIDTESGISKWAKRIREAWVKPFEESMSDLYDVFWDIGFKIGVNINSGLLKFNSNANNYKQTAMKIAQCLAAAINGIVDTPTLGYNIGAAIANVFNIVFSGLHQFATTVHWDDIGKFIGDGIAGALETFDWYQFFDTIVQFINGLANMIYNIAVGHPWGEIGKNIAQAILDALKNFDAAKAGKAVHEFLSALLDFINGFVERMSEKKHLVGTPDNSPDGFMYEYVSGWDLLARKIQEFWENVGSKDLGEKAGSAVSGGFLGFFKILSGGTDMMTAVQDFLDGFFDKINTYPWQSAMHDWWDVFYPKLKKFVEWAGPKLLELLQWLWDTISPKVTEIATDIGKTIGKAILEGMKIAVGKKVLDKFLGYDYEEHLKDEAIQDDKEATIGLKNRIANLTDDNINMIKNRWDELSDTTKEYLKKYRKEFGGTTPTVDPTLGATKSSKEYEEYFKAKPRYDAPKISENNAETSASSIKMANDVSASTAKVSDSYNAAASSAKNMADEVTTSTTKLSGSYNSAAESARQAGEAQNRANAAVAESANTSFTAAGSSAVTASNVIANGFGTASQAVQSSMGAIEPAAQDAYASVTQAFDQLTPYMEDTTGSAVQAFFATLRPSGELAQGLALATNSVVKSSVNTMVDAINTYAMTPLINLANLLDRLRTLNVGGMTPFMALPKFNFVKIPKLAQGAVLPPNQPFLSMVGDQRNGTNVEAPLDTIKQAVAEVMMENNDLLTAGFEAVVRAIQNKDMSVRIGDKDIYDANSNYTKRLNIMRGTV